MQFLNFKWLMAAFCLYILPVVAMQLSEEDVVVPEQLHLVKLFFDSAPDQAYFKSNFHDNKTILVEMLDGETHTEIKAAIFDCGDRFHEYKKEFQAWQTSMQEAESHIQARSPNTTQECTPAPAKRDDLTLLKRMMEKRSRCGQFCNNGLCSDSTCSKCRYAGGKCTWQRLCRK